jgi:hypothetical protein
VPLVARRRRQEPTMVYLQADYLFVST